MTKKADAYEKKYPGTGISEAQKHERMERLEFKERKTGTGRTSGSRFVSVPDMPWLHDKKENEKNDEV
jgi:hypothetical protein